MAKINLEKISEEQLERERNPNYKYFDVPELRYKDGTPMRKYNSPKLQAIEMENKQTVTAVEWLEKELKDRYPLMQSEPLFQQAKKMHKEQIMEGYMKAKLEHIDTLGLDVMKNKIINDTEQYYKETYGK